MKLSTDKILRTAVIGLGTTILVGGYSQNIGQAAILYQQTINTGSVATMSNKDISETSEANPQPNNCLVSEGCLGRIAEYVVPVAGNSGIFTEQSVIDRYLTFNFKISPQQFLAIQDSPGFGELTVRASRDIGRRRLSDGTFSPRREFLKAKGKELFVGDLIELDSEDDSLFKDIKSNCPAGNNTDANNNLSDDLKDNKCGSNFHNDGPKSKNAMGQDVFGVVDTILIPQDKFLRLPSMLLGGSDFDVSIVLEPTSGVGQGARVGRIKIFAVTLSYNSCPTPRHRVSASQSCPTSIPEPSSVLGLVSFGVLGVGSLILGQHKSKKASIRDSPDF